MNREQANIGTEQLLPRMRTGSATVSLVLGMLLLVEIILQSGLNPISPSDVAYRSVVYIVLALVLIAKYTPLSVWSPAFMFLFIFSLFHLGLVPHWIAGTDPGFPRPNDYNWFNGPPSIVGLQIVNLSILGYAIITLMVGSHLRTKPQVDKSRTQTSPPSHPEYAKAGAVLLLLGITMWTYYAFSSGGVQIFTGSYENFLEATANTTIYNSYHIISLGLCWTVIYARSNLSKFALVMFTIWGTLAFFLGLRGEVLFTVAAATSIIAVRRKMPRARIVIVVGILGLSVVNFAKEWRKVGVSGGEPSLAWLNPIDGVTELGSTFRVLAHEIDWHHLGEEEFAGGTTYLASVLRQWESLFGLTIPSPDFRMYNIYIQSREGTIGGSIVGEAFHNFGQLGAILIMGICAVIFTHFSFKLRSDKSAAVYGIIAVPLFNHVRNSFVPVIPMIILGTLLLITVTYISRKDSTGKIDTVNLRKAYDATIIARTS